MTGELDFEQLSDGGETVTISGIKLGIPPSRYSDLMIKVLREGKYEGEERTIVPRFITPADRIIEVGTAVGLVTMIAAKIVGDRHIKTIDANPEMLEDARKNFQNNDMSIATLNGVMVNRKNFQPGNIEFHIHRDFWSSSLVKSPSTVRTVSVPLLCMEDEFHAFGANAMICDIEGGEAALFPESDLRGINKLMLETHARHVGAEAIAKTVKAIQIQGFSIDYVNSWGGIVCFYRGF